MCSNVVHFIDVSGLKHHRKKWLQYFDDCLAVVFIVSLASYDQMMLEDSTSNRMKDALDLFEFICNNELLAKSDVIVFLNKFDVFKKKIQKTPIRNFFPDYNGMQLYTMANSEGDPNSYSDGLQYFKGKFESLNLSQSKTVSFHTTQCTNTSLMKKISAD
ncbi:G protein alpha subunit CIG1, partial [Globomyces pollinis-pini]